MEEIGKLIFCWFLFGVFCILFLVKFFIMSFSYQHCYFLLTLCWVQLMSQFREQLPSSIGFLEKCCQDQPCVKMPTAASFVIPSEKTDTQANWEHTVLVPAQEIACQVNQMIDK